MFGLDTKFVFGDRSKHPLNVPIYIVILGISWMCVYISVLQLFQLDRESEEQILIREAIQ